MNTSFLIYRAAEGNISVNAIVKDESIWLTQNEIAELFGVQTPAISKHLNNIFSEGELDEKVVVSKMEITTQHGAITGKTQIDILPNTPARHVATAAVWTDKTDRRKQNSNVLLAALKPMPIIMRR